jgi:type IV secretory pathway VirJ component
VRRSLHAGLLVAAMFAPALALAQERLLTDLPLHALPAIGTNPLLVVFLSGDGNWAELDLAVSEALVEHGVAVVGLESRAYLRRAPRKGPDVLARDLERILREYLLAWNRTTVAIVGYSRGAELAPFGASRLPIDLRRRLRLIALLGPPINANFTFHLSDLLGDRQRDDDIPMLPEVAKLSGTRILCVYGVEEKQSLCPLLPAGSARVVVKPGGHHFDKNFPALASLILDESKIP